MPLPGQCIPLMNLESQKTDAWNKIIQSTQNDVFIFFFDPLSEKQKILWNAANKQ